jgi:ribosomal protein S26
MKRKTKRCPGCKRDLRRTQKYFGRNKARGDGLASTCRECCAQIPRQRTFERRCTVDAVESAILTEREFWSAWDELLRTFLADDERYIAHHFSGDGRAGMENAR